jgi:hypothetical protein
MSKLEDLGGEVAAGYFDSNVKSFPVIYANYRPMTDAKRKPCRKTLNLPFLVFRKSHKSASISGLHLMNSLPFLLPIWCIRLELSSLGITTQAAHATLASDTWSSILQFVHNLFWLKLKWNARSNLFYFIIYRSSMLWWSSRTLTEPAIEMLQYLVYTL